MCCLVPGAPSQVTAVTKGCNSIQVSWNAVLFNGTQLDTYKVMYKQNSSDSQEIKMIVVNGLEVILQNLDHTTAYTTSVAAVSSDNITGAMSSEAYNTTFGGQ